MTDGACLCRNCGSVHMVESIRENLILDVRTAASYELPGQQGMSADYRAVRAVAAIHPGLARTPPMTGKGIAPSAQRRAARIQPGSALRCQ